MGASKLGRTRRDEDAWWRMGACTLNGGRVARSGSFVSWCVCRLCEAAVFRRQQLGGMANSSARSSVIELEEGGDEMR